MDFQTRFKDYMKLNMLDQPNWQNHKYVLGVSGGVDSIVLLDLFGLGFNADQIIVAHVDHQIRPESKNERLFVENFCRELGVKCFATSIDVTKIPGNLEANARLVRYNFFEQIRQDNAAEWIVTAHHADDQTETVVAGFLKGTFIRGLAGMEFMLKSKSLIRPMLFAEKTEIVNYAKQKKLSWVVDGSNFDSKYDRNFLRNEIIPQLEDRFENFGSRVNEAAVFYRELDVYLKDKVERWIAENGKLQDYGWVIDLRAYVKSPNFLRFMILQKLSGQVEQLNMGKANFGDIDDMLLRGNSGRWKEIGDKFVYIFDQHILVSNFGLSDLEEYYFGLVCKNFADELGGLRDKLLRFEDGMKVEVSFGDINKKNTKLVALKDFLKQQNIPWFFRKGVPVLISDNGLVDKCWVV